MALFNRRPPMQHKFCPVCGTQLKINDVYCLRCGYSFIARHKKARLAAKRRNFLFIFLILLVAYFVFRYYAGHPIIPSSLQDALNFSTNLTR